MIQRVAEDLLVKLPISAAKEKKIYILVNYKM